MIKDQNKKKSSLSQSSQVAWKVMRYTDLPPPFFFQSPTLCWQVVHDTDIVYAYPSYHLLPVFFLKTPISHILDLPSRRGLMGLVHASTGYLQLSLVLVLVSRCRILQYQHQCRWVFLNIRGYSGGIMDWTLIIFYIFSLVFSHFSTLSP